MKARKDRASCKGAEVVLHGLDTLNSKIPEQMAYELAKRGAKLVLVARRSEKMEAVSEKCHRLGAQGAPLSLMADVTKEQDCTRMVDVTIEKLGRLDGLVLNAGIAQAFLFEDAQNVKALMPSFTTDYWGSIWPAMHALPHLRRSNGQIVVVSSVAGFLPMARHSIYGSAKSAVAQFFDTLRAEPASRSVGITIAFPGPIASELTGGKVQLEDGQVGFNQERRDELLGALPMMDSSTCARTIISAATRRQRYAVVPKYFSVMGLARLFVPELLMAGISAQQVPWKVGQTAPSKQMLDFVGGQKLFYHPPTQDKEQAMSAIRSKADNQPVADVKCAMSPTPKLD
eukprot:jgi/Mesen1/4348/ME000022S03640